MVLLQGNLHRKQQPDNLLHGLLQFISAEPSGSTRMASFRPVPELLLTADSEVAVGGVHECILAGPMYPWNLL
jgi:hypothetical protein